jgi:uncharacterized protein YhfF
VSFPKVGGLRSLELGTPGPMRRRLNDLVLHGAKRATAGLVAEYESQNETIEFPGERLALLDDDLQSVATLVVTSAEIVRFADVPWEFAQAEAEGDTSIEEWRDGHRRFWAAEGTNVDDDTLVVLVRFTLASEAGA